MSTRGRTLEEEGFIHCSHEQQVVGVANCVYRGEHGLVLLVIEPDGIDAEIREETREGGAQPFPHVYGPLPIDAVIDVVPFQPRADGTFELPAAVRSFQIRPAVPADEDALVRLRAALWPETQVAEHAKDVARILAGRPSSTLPLAIFVAEADRTLLGFAEVGSMLRRAMSAAAEPPRRRCATPTSR